ncbi:hypothetical protein BYT27DRAFT_6682029 [Phlegmacium glaucopus]|nr:hypothetical protein BYT27DRAFT_6682029 [Phlegmacium glaucopus]
MLWSRSSRRQDADRFAFHSTLALLLMTIFSTGYRSGPRFCTRRRRKCMHLRSLRHGLQSTKPRSIRMISKFTVTECSTSTGPGAVLLVSHTAAALAPREHYAWQMDIQSGDIDDPWPQSQMLPCGCCAAHEAGLQ